MLNFIAVLFYEFLPFLHFSDHFLTMICKMTMQYKEICLAAYRGVVQPESEDKRIISAQWAKDEDIARFLKALPNWQAVQEGVSSSHEVITESPQEVEDRNAKETTMLKRNLGGYTDIPAHEILYDPNQLRSLAQLQESLDWFSKAVLVLAAGFGASNSSKIGGHLRLSDNSVQTLTSLAREFEELADTCLLVLHLEVRVHCFHYLHSIWKGPAGAQFAGGPESTEPLNAVTKMTKDLLLIGNVQLFYTAQEKTAFILTRLFVNIKSTILVGLGRLSENTG